MKNKNIQHTATIGAPNLIIQRDSVGRDVTFVYEEAVGLCETEQFCIRVTFVYLHSRLSTEEFAIS